MSTSTAPVSGGAKPLQTIPQSMTLRALLDQRRAEGRRMSIDEAIAVVVPICLDLKDRHEKGEKLYVHPSAIAPSPDGLAKLNPRLALVPTNPLDRHCLAPELQSTLEPGDARASVYSIGAILYEMCTGHHVGPAMPRPRDVEPTLPESFEILIGKAIIGDRKHRPEDLGALASAMYHLAPQKSIHPPEIEEAKLDESAELEVDVRFSMMPPAAGLPPLNLPRAGIPKGMGADPSSGGQPAAAAPRAPHMNNSLDPFGGVIERAPSPRRADDPTTKLALLKQQLESDPRPRYVINKDKMDHGPFTAVELLQQIASNTFVVTHNLRDEISGQSKPLSEWEEFAPFADQANLKREIIAEEKAVVRAVAAEKKSGIAKFVIGGIAITGIIAVLVVWVLTKRGTRNEAVSVDVDNGGGSVELDGGIKAHSKGHGHGTGGGGTVAANGQPGGGGGGGAGDNGGGASFESVLDNNVDTVNVGGADVPDLTRAQLAAPMRVAGCGIPKGVKVTVQVAVKNGRAAGVSVRTDPNNPGVAGGCAAWARGLGWPSSPKADFVTTVYGPYND